MRKSLMILATLAMTSPAFASDDDYSSMAGAPADLAIGTLLGKDPDAIRTALTSLGYDVRKIDMEYGKIEAYVVKDRFMAEVYVNTATGEVTRVGLDD